jgi:hypothetical protein
LDVMGRVILAIALAVDDCFTRKNLDSSVHITPIRPGEILFLRANCLHWTGFPVLKERETMVRDSYRLHILIGSDHAMDEDGYTTQTTIYHLKWPKTSTNEPSLSKIYDINKQIWVLAEEGNDCSRINNQSTEVDTAPIPL